MTELVFRPAPPTCLTTTDGRRFPVRRIYCVGQNYPDHAREMGGDPDRSAPFFFTKPADAIVAGGAKIPYPPRTQNLHPEVELVAAIGAPGANILAEAALVHIWGYAVGIDLTRRDIQRSAKAKRQPWDMAKAFDCSAPIGDLAPAAVIGHPAFSRIALAVNRTERQSANIEEMIWKPGEIVAELSRYVRLEPGDIIFTGTPAGVSATGRGDVVEARIEGLPVLTVEIA